MQNQQLAKELHKPIIRKLGKWKVCSSFKDKIWGVDRASVQLISKFREGIYYLLCYWYYSKYAWIVLLKDKKSTTITNAIQRTLDESNHKLNNI